MNGLIGHGSIPVSLNMVWLFFLITSILVFIMGVGLALRSSSMLRLFDLMNRWISVGTVIKQHQVPHFVEPVLIKRPILLGVFVVAGAAASVLTLRTFSSEVFLPLFLGHVPHASAVILAACTKWLLVIGNSLCVLVGLLMLLSPSVLSRLETVADTWYSVRKDSSLQVHNTGVDQWVLANPTVSGVALIVMSLGLATSVLARL